LRRKEAVGTELTRILCRNDKSLLQALRSNNQKLIQQIVKENPYIINSPLDDEGRTLLHIFANTGNLAMLQFIFSRSWQSKENLVEINIDVQNNSGFTPFHEATRNNMIDVVNYLIHLGADPNLKDGHWRTALHWATENQLEDIGLIITSLPRTDIRVTDMFGRTPLHWCAKKGLDKLTLVLLQNSDITYIDKQTHGGETALHWACLEGHDSIVELLLQAGANPNILNTNEQSPLLLAVTPSSRNMIQAAIAQMEEIKLGKQNDIDKAYGQNTWVSSGNVTHLKPKQTQTKKLKITLKK